MEVEYMQIELSQHPESTFQLLSRSSNLYKATLSKVFLMALALAIIVFIPRLAALITGYDIFATLNQHPLQWLWIPVIELALLMLFSEVLWRLHCKLHHTQDTVLEDVIISVKKLPFIFIAAIIQSSIITLISTAILMMLYFVPREALISPNPIYSFFICATFIAQSITALYLFLSFYFYLPLILTEDKGIFSAIKRSSSLVWGNWWRTAKLQIIPWIFYIVTLALLRYVLHINVHIYFIKSPTAYSWIITCLQILIFALFTPWFASTMLVQLRDLELRKKASLS
jgi:hypothetical protein